MKRATACKVKQSNGFEFDYGIKIKINRFFITCVHVQPSCGVTQKKLREAYINSINAFNKKNDAIDYINKEIEMGYLTTEGLIAL